MTPSSILSRSLAFLFGIGLIAGAAGCSLQQSDDFRAVTVENAMEDSVAFWATTGHNAALVDPVPQAAVKEFGGFILEPGAAATLQKSDVMGNYTSDASLYLLLYEVRRDSVYGARGREYSYEELEQRDFHVEILGFSKE